MIIDGTSEYRALVLHAASLVAKGLTAAEVHQALLAGHPHLTERDFQPGDVYTLLARGAAIGLLKVLPVPDIEVNLVHRIKSRFPGIAGRTIRVVDTSKELEGRAGDALSAVAADFVFDLLKAASPGANGDAIGIGLGPGRATLDFSRHLSARLAADRRPPQLNLFAITAGCLPRYPEYAPISFFNLFPSHIVDERIGLFAENLIPASEYGLMKTRPGVNVAFQEKHKIRIVVTAMGSMDDPHDILRLFFEEADADVTELGAIGNVQYRPFSSTGIVHERNDQLRAVTLFELRELADLSTRQGHHVVLIARRCGICHHKRAHAVRALLETEELAVFSTLIMDAVTAEAVLSGDP